ncbi:MAG: DUF1080 domain-containing protein [Acidobacteriaceae bacterium]|nr:DUF1080 domain-containing protein [Acidobacteriaceae bacterium]MBV9441377.1 DUF1080 domain-containing protein [Acidobacteriaceae bacterium]
MNRFIFLTLGCGLLPFACYGQSGPFVGAWGFDVPTRNGIGANWLGISDKGGKLDVWFQPTGGHVFQIENSKVDGSHLTLMISGGEGNKPPMVWKLDAKGGKLVGTQTQGDETIQLTGKPEPALNRPEPKSWRAPQALFDGKDLEGWQPIGNVAENHWTVQNGDLVNLQHGANLKTTPKFTDFKLHFEVNCPDNANSGFYLRGRYELQLEYERVGENPPNRAMGSIYGRIAPSVQLPRKPGQWETYDVTLVGRTVTVVRDGTITIDHQKIDGITGGALDADEGEPGPFYIQGDHTGGLKFRNITVALPAK